MKKSVYLFLPLLLLMTIGTLPADGRPGVPNVDSKLQVAIVDPVVLTLQTNDASRGTTNPSPGQYTYERGDTVDIHALPVSGNRFVQWACYVGNHYSPDTYVIMKEDETVTAIFEEIDTDDIDLEMTVVPYASGMTTPAVGHHTYPYGTVVNVSAVPDEGYVFKCWDGDVADQGNPNTTVTLTTHKKVSAWFEKIFVRTARLKMKVEPEEGGTTIPEPGNHDYPTGDTISISALPNAGYTFSHWDGDVEDPDSADTDIILIENKTVKAVFLPSTVTLTVHIQPAQGGQITPSAGDHTYFMGDTVNLSASPKDGYLFSGWTGDVFEPDSQNTMIVMNEDKSVFANFEWNRVTLTMSVTPDNAGTVAPSKGTHEYTKGDTVPIQAFPKNNSYAFTGWLGDVLSPDSASTHVVMDTSKSVTAQFAFLDNGFPELYGCYPPPQSQGIPANTDIKFKVKDAETGIMMTSLNVWVKSVQIVQNGIDLTGGQVLLTPHSSGYKVLYEPINDFGDGENVDVRVTASDMNTPSNDLDSTYSFVVCSAKINKTVQTQIDSTGGSVTDDDSGISIHIPANALDDSVEITIGPVEDPPSLPDDVTGYAVPYHFGPDGLEFQIPVVVEIPYTPEILVDGGVSDPADLRIFYFHTSTGEWTELTVDSVDTEHKILYVTVQQFCYFTFAGDSKTNSNTSVNGDNAIPGTFKLSQNYPNPFNPETRIAYEIAESSHLTLKIYSSNGTLIRTLVDQQKQSGIYETIWNGKNDRGNQVSSGIYILKMRAGNHFFVRKMSFLK